MRINTLRSTGVSIHNPRKSSVTRPGRGVKYYVTTLILSVLLTFTVGLLPAVSQLAYAGHATDKPGGSPPPPGPPCPPGAQCCGGGPPPGGPPPPPPPPPPPGKKGDPIDLYTGYWLYGQTDMVVEGVMDISIQRRYASQSTYDSPLGYGWGFNYDQRLYRFDDNSITMRFNCGYQSSYVSSGGQYTPLHNFTTTLQEEADGSYILGVKSGGFSKYDAQGRLLYKQDERGNRLEMLYDPAGKFDLIGSSPFALNPDSPAVVSSDYRLTKIQERLADGTLSGNSVSFTYAANGRVDKITASDGREVSYEFDTSNSGKYGNLTQVNGLDGLTSIYEYNDPNDLHNVTSVQKGMDSPYVNTYDTQGRVTQQTHGLDVLSINYAIPLMETIVTHTLKNSSGATIHTIVETFEFNEYGDVVLYKDGEGHEQRVEYDANRNVTSREVWQNENNSLSLYQSATATYDALSNMLTKVVVLDSFETITSTWTYDHQFVASEETVSSFEPSKIFRTETIWNHDAQGKPTTVQETRRIKADGSAQITSYTYDAQGRLLTTTLPDGVQMVNEYTGDFLSKTYYKVNGTAIPQLEQRFEYDSRGNLHKTWDANNNLTQMDYDDQGRVVKETNALNQEDIYTYNQDVLTQVERGRVGTTEGQIAKLIYDAEKRLIEVQRKNDAGEFETYKTMTYDSTGNLLSQSDVLNRTNTFEYDALGRLIKEIDPLLNETAYAYDAMGNQIRVIDALGNETRQQYDAMNRLVELAQLGITPHPVSRFSYDAVGNLVSVTDAENKTTQYVYDALSRKTAEILPLGQSIQYEYDSRDRLTRMINANSQKIEYHYEPWGGVIREEWFADSASTAVLRTIEYDYDLVGNTISVSDDGIQASPLYSQTWDELNRLDVQSIEYIPGGDRTITYDYDAFGNVVQMLFNDAGEVFTQSHQFNVLNRLIGANLPSSQAYSFDYFGNDDLKQITHPNGLTTDFSYKANGPVEGIHIKDGASVIQSLDYTYDAVNNIQTQTDSAGMHDFNYDGIYRLTEADRPSTLNTLLGIPDESFGYDLVGNRTQSGSETSFNYDDNQRMSQSPGLSYIYDDAGNTKTRSDGANFVYDHRNRLTQYSNQNATTAHYAYLPNNLRLKKTIGSQTTWFVYLHGQLLSEYDSAGTRLKRYAYLPWGGLSAQVEDSNGIYEVHGDHLNTPRQLTDSSKAVVWESTHEAFGKAYINEDVDSNGNTIVFNQGFPGQYRDQESGLVYNWNRYYDPSTGRYITSDPIGLIGGINRFAYVFANPLRYSDPRGLCVPNMEGNPDCNVEIRKRTPKSQEWDEVTDWLLYEAAPFFCIPTNRTLTKWLCGYIYEFRKYHYWWKRTWEEVQWILWCKNEKECAPDEYARPARAHAEKITILKEKNGSKGKLSSMIYAEENK